MPLYDYECKSCGHRFENIQKFSDPIITKCPVCGEEDSVERLLSAPAVQFKGSGWYVTDYANKTSSKGSAGTPKDGKSESKTSDVKAEAAPAAKPETKTPSSSSGKSE